MVALMRTLRAVLLGVLLSLVALEAGARAWLRYGADTETQLRYASLRELAARERRGFFARHWYLGYALTPSWEHGENRHDPRGFRGEDVVVPKPENEFRIVCLGGSTTYGYGVRDWRQAYPACLAREMRRRGHANVTVVNAGCANWTTWESTLQVPLRLLELEPDLFVVYHGINDLKTRTAWPPERYRPDNSGARSVPSTYLMPPIHEHSAFWRIIAIQAGWMLSHVDLERTLDTPTTFERWPEFSKQLKRGVYPEAPFDDVSFADMMAANPPTYFEQNLRSLCAMAREFDIEVVLTTFVLWPQPLRRSPRGAEELAGALQEMNAVLPRVAEQCGARVFDLAAAMPLEKRYFVDFVHFSAEGNEVWASLLADWLERHREW